MTDYFTLPGFGQYLVMDFVTGKDLATLMGEQGALPEAHLRVWIDQVCDALEYLHSQQPPVIHRDIKPDNIKVDTHGKAMLVDFGIAKAYDPNRRTTRGAQAYSPGFSPPEQYGASGTDARADVYALGATLYALLTCYAPPESLDLTLGQTLTPPRALNPAISPAVEAVILRAMRPQPAERFQSVGEMRLALQLAYKTHYIQSQPAPRSEPYQPSQPLPVRPALLDIFARWFFASVAATAGVVLLGFLVKNIMGPKPGGDVLASPPATAAARGPATATPGIPAVTQPAQTQAPGRILTAAPAPTQTPFNSAAPSPYRGWLVFGWGPPESRRLYLQNPQTDQRLPVASGDYPCEAPSSSPDGRRIAFVSNRPPDGWEVYVYDFDSRTERQVTRLEGELEARYPAWSPAPGDERIAFVVRNPKTFVNPDGSTFAYLESNIWLVNLDGSGLRQATNSNADASPVWSPDGQQILFGRAQSDTSANGVVTTSDNLDLYILDLEHGALDAVTQTPGEDDFDYNWSPDGNWIVYTSARKDQNGNGVVNLDDSRNLFLIHPDGSGWQKLDTGELMTFRPDWTLDGQGILFGASTNAGDGQYVLYVIDVNTGRYEEVTQPGLYYHAEWMK